MNRNEASQFCRTELNQHGLKDWKVRLNSNPDWPFLGMCVHNDEAIILNAHHIDIHPHAEVINTIRHEIAHALVGSGNGHNSVWETKAREIGCDNTLPCSHLDIPAHVIDAIRSGATVEFEVHEERVEHIIRTPKYTVTRLQEKCPYCGKVAKEIKSVESVDRKGNQIKMITLDCFHIITKIIPKATPFEEMVSNDWKKEVKECKHSFAKNQCSVCGEYKLFNFQVTGARAAETALAVGKGFLIADDMGLGKTVQGLALPKYHPELVPFLVITKSAALYQWFSQSVRWLGPQYFSQIIRTGRDKILPGVKSYIISYDLLRRMPEAKKEQLASIVKLVIIDEVQQIKNPDSSRTQEVRKLIKDPKVKVVELSATPWKNRGSEFFTALNLIDPIKFWSHQHFLDTWVDYYWNGNKKKMAGIKNIPKFKDYTKNLIIRREFNEVIDEYPDLNKVKLRIQLDELNQSTYEDSESEFVQWYNDFVIGGEEEKISGIALLAKMQRMRHITGLAKIPATLDYIEQFLEETEKKIVVFVHHKDVGDILFDSLHGSNPDYQELADKIKSEGIKTFKYHSGLNALERTELQDAFNNAPRAVMIASTLAAGESINLQTCSDAILHERQWNPQNEEQAAPGRFRRIGQLSKVINITVVEAEGTIDEELDNIVAAKAGFYHDAMNKGEMVRWDEGEIGKKLAAAIVAKHRARNKGKRKTSITNKANRNLEFVSGF